MVLETRSPKSRWQQDHAPLGVPGGSSLPLRAPGVAAILGSLASRVSLQLLLSPGVHLVSLLLQGHGPVGPGTSKA